MAIATRPPNLIRRVLDPGGQLSKSSWRVAAVCFALWAVLTMALAVRQNLAWEMATLMLPNLPLLSMQLRIPQDRIEALETEDQLMRALFLGLFFVALVLFTFAYFRGWRGVETSIFPVTGLITMFGRVRILSKAAAIDGSAK